MRECWINVSVIDRGQGRREAITGSCWATREEAARGTLVDYRLHVRLKPDRLDGLEDMARQMMTIPNPVTAKHGAMRLRMIQAARAKGVR